MQAHPEETAHRRLHHELQQAIALINRDQISAVSGVVTRESYFNLAKMVARLRARYLSTVFELGNRYPDELIPTEMALELKKLREACNEAIEGFDAVEHALHRGYVRLSDAG